MNNNNQYYYNKLDVFPLNYTTMKNNIHMDIIVNAMVKMTCLIGL